MMRINLHPNLRGVLLKALRRERANEDKVIRRKKTDYGAQYRGQGPRAFDMHNVTDTTTTPPEWFDGTQHIAHLPPSVDRFVTTMADTFPTETTEAQFRHLEQYRRHTLSYPHLKRMIRLMKIKQSHVRIAVRAYLRLTNADRFPTQGR